MGDGDRVTSLAFLLEGVAERVELFAEGNGMLLNRLRLLSREIPKPVGNLDLGLYLRQRTLGNRDVVQVFGGVFACMAFCNV